MEIKRVQDSKSLSNNESEHRERRRYDPQLLQQNSSSQKAVEKPTREEVKKMVEEINKFLKVQETSIKYEYHEKLHEYYVKVVNSSTNEVIREIPPKKLLDLYAYVKEKIGLIIDKKA